MNENINLEPVVHSSDKQDQLSAILDRFNLKFSIIETTFWTAFILIYILSGVLRLSPLPYRMAMASTLAIPLFILFRFRWSHTYTVASLLVLVGFISYLFNPTSPLQLFDYLRIPIFAYLTYYIAKMYLNPGNIKKVIYWFGVLSVIQLPIILMQWQIYPLVPQSLLRGVAQEDFGFGTFNVATDYSLTLFLLLFSSFLLFDQKRNYVFSPRVRWFLIIWASLTILIANAQILKLIMVFVWGIYILVNIRIRTLVTLVGVILIALLFSYFLESQLENLDVGGFEGVAGLIRRTESTVTDLLSVNTLDTNAFLDGEYDRPAAISYYLNQNILWFGEGPARYRSALENTRSLGNTGHIFTFYSEVGLIGLVLSYLFYVTIAIPISGRMMRISIYRLVMLVVIFLLSFTSHIMMDIAIVMSFTIMAQTHLIPPQLEPSKPNERNP